MGYLLATVLVVLLSAALIIGVAELRDRRRVNPTDPRTKNHQLLVRWADNILEDDMVAPLLSEKQRTQGRELVAAYYNERTK